MLTPPKDTPGQLELCLHKEHGVQGMMGLRTVLLLFFCLQHKEDMNELE